MIWVDGHWAANSWRCSPTTWRETPLGETPHYSPTYARKQCQYEPFSTARNNYVHTWYRKWASNLGYAPKKLDIAVVVASSSSSRARLREVASSRCGMRWNWWRRFGVKLDMSWRATSSNSALFIGQIRPVHWSNSAPCIDVWYSLVGYDRISSVACRYRTSSALLRIRCRLNRFRPVRDKPAWIYCAVRLARRVEMCSV